MTVPEQKECLPAADGRVLTCDQVAHHCSYVRGTIRDQPRCWGLEHLAVADMVLSRPLPEGADNAT